MGVKPTKEDDRRSFLTTAAKSTAGIMVLKPKTVFGSQANSKITMGVIGSGGRGQFVAKKFFYNAEKDVQFVAAHDYFPDRLRDFMTTFDVDESRGYTGLYGYREILESDVDGVAITSPPYFHPQQAADAVAAGKHVWLAKPIATDVPGSLSIKETGRKAEGKVAFLVDFQSRNSPFFLEAVKRVHDGAIGEIVSGEAFNHFGSPGWRDMPDVSEDVKLLRNWGTNNILSGDCIVEQAVHAVDIVNWLVGKHPTSAFGTGGQKVRVNTGNNWDHFTVTYWYGDGAVVDLNCSQFVKGYHNLGARMYGAKGIVNAYYRAKDWGTGPVSITGENEWEGTPLDNTWDLGVDQNCKDFVKAVRSGRYMNHAESAADSTLTAILGRTAAYERREVGWDEIVKANVKLDPKLKL